MFRADRAAIFGTDSPRLAGRENPVRLETARLACSGFILPFKLATRIGACVHRQPRASCLLCSQSNARHFLPYQHVFYGDKAPCCNVTKHPLSFRSATLYSSALLQWWVCL